MGQRLPHLTPTWGGWISPSRDKRGLPPPRCGKMTRCGVTCNTEQVSPGRHYDRSSPRQQTLRGTPAHRKTAPGLSLAPFWGGPFGGFFALIASRRACVLTARQCIDQRAALKDLDSTTCGKPHFVRFTSNCDTDPTCGWARVPTSTPANNTDSARHAVTVMEQQPWRSAPSGKEGSPYAPPRGTCAGYAGAGRFRLKQQVPVQVGRFCPPAFGAGHRLGR